MPRKEVTMLISAAEAGFMAIKNYLNYIGFGLEKELSKVPRL